ncbi:MAG: tetratricopeptide repeat protein [Phycisphaerales bacterium]
MSSVPPPHPFQQQQPTGGFPSQGTVVYPPGSVQPAASSRFGIGFIVGFATGAVICAAGALVAVGVLVGTMSSQSASRSSGTRAQFSMQLHGQRSPAPSTGDAAPAPSAQAPDAPEMGDASQPPEEIEADAYAAVMGALEEDDREHAAELVAQYQKRLPDSTAVQALAHALAIEDAIAAEDAARADRELTLALEQGLDIPVSVQTDVVGALVSDEQNERAIEVATRVMGLAKGGDEGSRYYRSYLLYLRGIARSGSGDLSQALADLRRAVALAPDEDTRSVYRQVLAELLAQGQ